MMLDVPVLAWKGPLLPHSRRYARQLVHFMKAPLKMKTWAITKTTEVV